MCLRLSLGQILAMDDAWSTLEELDFTRLNTRTNLHNSYACFLQAGKGYHVRAICLRH